MYGHQLGVDPSYTVVDGKQVTPPSDASTDVGDEWGNTDTDYLTKRIKQEYQKYGKTATDADVQNWLGYMQKPDEIGNGQTIQGWDPYWQMRMGYGIQGKDYEAQFKKPSVQPNSLFRGFGNAGGITQLVPTDLDTYNTLQQRIMDLLGGSETFDKQALLAQMTK
jgi:hypothetical protein